MTKDDIYDLVRDTHNAVGCGCCGNGRQVDKDIRETVEAIWEAMEKLKHKEQE